MARRLLALLLVPLLAALLAVTTGALPVARAAVPGSAVTAATPTAGTAHKAGDALYVEWGGSWWKATALAPLPDGRTVIHYDGWSDDHDEIAKPRRIRTTLPVKAAPAVGESVFVEWKGSFWPTKVLKVSGTGGQASYRVHYDGYGPEWDEDVTSSRLTRLSPPEG